MAAPWITLFIAMNFSSLGAPILRRQLPALLLLTSQARAQSLSSRPVTLLVPYPAGGLSDVVARTVQPVLARVLGQTVLVENLGGASGGIAAQKALIQPADGLTIFQGSPNELLLAPLANTALRYASEDFRLLQRMTVNPIVIFTRKDLPVRDADELAALARQRSEEGQPLSYASVGNGTLYHLLGEQFGRRVGARLLHVPYKGGAPAYQDLMAGQVDLFITVFSHKEVQLVRDGRMKVIASLAAHRQPLFPDAPSVDEGRALRGFHHHIWSGYFVRSDTPQALAQRMHDALTQVVRDPALRQSLQAQAMVVPEPEPLTELAQTYRKNLQNFRELALNAGMDIRR
jgi:tripartite-type tricarboxylate transporter receptor subunit TctC